MKNGKKLLAGTLGVLGLVALITQWFISYERDGLGVLGNTIRLYSFFTIITNTLIGLSFLAHAVKKENRVGFLALPSTSAALAVYITIVGVVYNVMLRQTWHPEGLQRVIDEWLHVVNPIVYVLFWYVAVPKQGISFKSIISWLYLPLAYMAYTFIRGALTAWYPYPFIDVNTIGYPQAIITAGILLVVFGVFSALFVLIARKKNG
jgi:hypothetical protein